MRGWLLKHGVARSPRGDHQPPSVAGRVLPTRGGPAAEAVATVGTAMRCGLIPVTCCMLWWLLIGGSVERRTGMCGLGCSALSCANLHLFDMQVDVCHQALVFFFCFFFFWVTGELSILTGAWLTPNQIPVPCHTVPVTPQDQGDSCW